jgi:hypothetical protein
MKRKKRPRLAKTTFKKKNEVGAVTHPNFKDRLIIRTDRMKLKVHK